MVASYIKKIKKEKKQGNIFIPCFIIITSLISVSCILIYNQKTEYNLVALLPLSYLVFSLLFFYIMGKFHFYKYGILFYFANIVLYIRYVITPLAAIYTQYNKGWGANGREGWGPNPSSSSMNDAILLMIVEMLFIFIAMILSSMRDQKIKKSSFPESNGMPQFLDNKIVVIFYVIAAIPFIAAVAPNVFSINSFMILNKDYQSTEITYQYAGLVTLLYNVMKTALFLLALSIMYKQYLKKSKFRYIFFSFIFLIIYLGVNVSTSRWGILFPLLCSFSIFYQLYPKIPKTFVITAISILTISILSISVYKFSWLVRGSENPFRDIIGVVFSQCQDYFSGPRVVAQSLDMKSMMGSQISINTFFNDILGNFPGLADHINQNDRINAYFNYYNYNTFNHTVLIMPMLGIGYCYFPVFPPIFTVLCEYFMIKLDRVASETKIIEYKYAYLYLGFFLAMCIGFNTQIILGSIWGIFLPLMLLFYINKKILLRDRKPVLHSKYIINRV